MVNLSCFKNCFRKKEKDPSKDDKKELLSDNSQMLFHKKGELQLLTQKFKSEQLEQEYQTFFTPSNALRCLIGFLLIQQLLTKIQIDDAYDDKKRIAYFVFCGLCLLLVKAAKFVHLQKMNWLVCIFSILVLADCFLESDEKSELRILFNGMAIVITFQIQGHNILFDAFFIAGCFILLHIFKGIDEETALLSIFTVAIMIFLKYQNYIFHRETYLSLQLANYWQEFAKEVSFVQMIIFEYDSEEEKFYFRGSKQSSEQFYKVQNNDSLNYLLDSLVIESMIKGPAHQFKEFVRNTGKEIKPVLIKCFTRSMWPYHIDQQKCYVGVVKFQNFNYKFNIRGINSEDKIFTLSLSLVDPESLRETNEKMLMQQNLLQVYLWNSRNRYLEMEKELQLADDSKQIQNIMDRTTQSLSYQSKVVKFYVQEEVKQEQNQKFEDSKNKVEDQNLQINLINSQLSNPKANLMKKNESNRRDSQTLGENNKNEQLNNENQIMVDKNYQNDLIQKNIKNFKESLPEEDDIISESTMFNLRDEIFTVLGMYNDQVDIAFNLDEDTMMNTGHQEFRQFLIQIFENCYNLRKLEGIKAIIKFTQSNDQEDEKSSEFIVQMIIDENSTYFYRDKNDENYQHGETWYQALSRPFRYLNGNNHKLINSIEFQYFTGYLQSMHNKQMDMEQNHNCQILSTFWIFCDPAKSFREIEEAQNQKGSSKNEFEIDDNVQDNPFIASHDEDDMKHESFVKSYSVKPSEFKNNKQALKFSAVEHNYSNKQSPSYLNPISPQQGIIINGLQNRTTENNELNFKLDNTKTQDNTKKHSQEQNDDQDCSYLDENMNEYIPNISNSIKQIKNYEDKFKTLHKQDI